MFLLSNDLQLFIALDVRKPEKETFLFAYVIWSWNKERDIEFCNYSIFFYLSRGFPAFFVLVWA